ncbi:MAG: peptidoglycan-binding protein [Micrococcales bacterium]|nr:peptidoglycan-binding protein [Micrococcales bacterium]
MQVQAMAISGVVLGALLVPAIPATATEAAGLQVCHFPQDPLDAARPNPVYPFHFLLTTRLQDTENRRVRKAVRSVQMVLARMGIRDGAGREVVADGSYGPRTASVVRRFQQRKDLTVDGAVGPQTWRRLSRSCWLFH